MLCPGLVEMSRELSLVLSMRGECGYHEMQNASVGRAKETEDMVDRLWRGISGSERYGDGVGHGVRRLSISLFLRGRYEIIVYIIFLNFIIRVTEIDAICRVSLVES